MIDIETYIPSQTYKKFLQDNQLELNARQQAKLICISRNSLDDKWAGYRALLAIPLFEWRSDSVGKPARNLRSEDIALSR